MAITAQQLDDAATDAEALAIFVNGPGDSVETRTGGTIPTLPKLIADIPPSGFIASATYAALAVLLDYRAGALAIVPASDAGTHADPVVGGVVSNGGVYRWSDAPAGWERLFSTDSLVAVLADALAASAAANGSAVDAANSLATLLAALAAGAVAGVYNTHALATAAVGGIAANALVRVLADEDHNGVGTLYQKSGGVLVFVGEASGGPASMFQIATVQPATPDTGTDQVGINYVYPDRLDADGLHTNYTFRLTFEFHPYPASPAGGSVPGAPKFSDLGARLGFNTDPEGNRADGANPSFYDVWESKFYGASREAGNPVVKWFERHYQVITLQGDVIRPFSGTFPHNTHDWNYASDVGFRSSAFTLYCGNGEDFGFQLFMTGEAGAVTPQMNLGDRFLINHPTNNSAVITQLSADGSRQWQHPFVDNHDQYALELGISQNVSTWAANSLGLYSAHCITAQNPPDNCDLRMLTFGGPDLHTVTDLRTQGSASVVVRWLLENQDAAGAARLDISAAGDAAILFTHSATGRQGTLKLTNDGQRLEVDKPIKFPGGNVGALPAAATAGAGARMFVNDATSTVFHDVVVGGGANFVPVFSDGADWRIG